MDDRAAGEVAAMQFAGGRSIAAVAAEWEREPEWVEAAIRQALLEYVPRRDGGLKPTRAEARSASAEELAAARGMQETLWPGS